MDSARRVALFGGTFDPVHEGHLSIARAARESLELDQVVFIPVYPEPGTSEILVGNLVYEAVAQRLRGVCKYRIVQIAAPPT